MVEVRQPRKRRLLSPTEKIEARDRTDAVAKQTIEDERRRRDEKSERLRQARLQAAEEQRQL
jgi:hypothetical protein